MLLPLYTAITSWGQPDITVISGYDIVFVSELSVTGLAKGQATLKIEIVANCSFMGIVINKPVYTVNLTVLVE